MRGALALAALLVAPGTGTLRTISAFCLWPAPKDRASAGENAIADADAFAAAFASSSSSSSPPPKPTEKERLAAIYQASGADGGAGSVRGSGGNSGSGTLGGGVSRGVSGATSREGFALTAKEEEYFARLYHKSVNAPLVGVAGDGGEWGEESGGAENAPSTRLLFTSGIAKAAGEGDRDGGCGDSDGGAKGWRARLRRRMDTSADGEVAEDEFLEFLRFDPQGIVAAAQYRRRTMVRTRLLSFYDYYSFGRCCGGGRWRCVGCCACRALPPTSH